MSCISQTTYFNKFFNAQLTHPTCPKNQSASIHPSLNGFQPRLSENECPALDSDVHHFFLEHCPSLIKDYLKGPEYLLYSGGIESNLTSLKIDFSTKKEEKSLYPLFEEVNLGSEKNASETSLTSSDQNFPKTLDDFKNRLLDQLTVNLLSKMGNENPNLLSLTSFNLGKERRYTLNDIDQFASRLQLKVIEKFASEKHSTSSLSSDDEKSVLFKMSDSKIKELLIEKSEAIYELMAQQLIEEFPILDDYPEIRDLLFLILKFDLSIQNSINRTGDLSLSSIETEESLSSADVKMLKNMCYPLSSLRECSLLVRFMCSALHLHGIMAFYNHMLTIPTFLINIHDNQRTILGSNQLFKWVRFSCFALHHILFARFQHSSPFKTFLGNSFLAVLRYFAVVKFLRNRIAG